MTTDAAQPSLRVTPPRDGEPEADRQDTHEVDRHEGANLDLVVLHYYLAREAGPEDPIHAVYRAMLTDWERREGTIKSSFFCENIRAAAVMTDRDRVFSAGDPYGRREDLPLYRLVTRADHLGAFIEESLIGTARRGGIEDVYAIETNALACMDALAETPAPSPQEAKDLRSLTCKKIEADLARAEHDAHTAWQRRAQIAYLEGMGLGVFGVGAIVLLIAGALRPLLASWPEIPSEIFYVPWALLLGAVGAALSVMQRLTRGNLHLRLDSTLTENRILGAFRPVVGSAFGLALIILVLGGLIPLTVPETDPKASFFLVGIAFLAGFSERFAQDMISVGTATRIGAVNADDARSDAVASGSPVA